jgi:hypothetical protein
VRADVLAPHDRLAGDRRRARLRGLHGAELRAAECGEPAGGEARAAEEGAAIERAGAETGRQSLQLAAGRVARPALDQHGPSPQYRLVW